MAITKKIFMLKKIIKDIFKKNTFKINDDLKSEKLGKYYFDFEVDTKKLNALIKTFDENGIPLNTTYIDVENPKLHYYPISIGQFGLAVFHSYLQTNSEDKKAHFLRIADWFMQNRIDDEKLGTYWLTDVPKPEYKVFSPWKSAFTQSRAISILLRAWQITSNNEYLEVSKKALIPYTYDISEGGVTANLKAEKPFYEEYVASEPTMVLDGHIFSLFGLYDFVRAIPENLDKKNHSLAEKLFYDGVKSLIYWLPEYDMGFWLRFNYCKMKHYPQIDPCTIGYLRLVIAQLKILFKITNIIELKNYAEKFEKYDNWKNIIKMYYIKYKALKKLNRL